jgi:hypothetical protein
MTSCDVVHKKTTKQSINPFGWRLLCMSAGRTASCFGLAVGLFQFFNLARPWSFVLPYASSFVPSFIMAEPFFADIKCRGAHKLLAKVRWFCGCRFVVLLRSANFANFVLRIGRCLTYRTSMYGCFTPFFVHNYGTLVQF